MGWANVLNVCIYMCMYWHAIWTSSLVICHLFNTSFCLHVCLTENFRCTYSTSSSTGWCRITPEPPSIPTACPQRRVSPAHPKPRAHIWIWLPASWLGGSQCSQWKTIFHRPQHKDYYLGEKATYFVLFPSIISGGHPLRDAFPLMATRRTHQES